MITSKARDGFDRLLMRGIEASIALQCEDICEVSIDDDVKEIKATKCVVLTISSYLFRLMILVHFTPDVATKSLFVKSSEVDQSSMSEQCFIDAVSEFTNMCSGALARDLSPIFRHVGMSTPNVLDAECASFLHLLKCGHVQHFNADIKNYTRLHFSLCVSEYSDIDFEIGAVAEDSTAGELEMF